MTKVKALNTSKNRAYPKLKAAASGMKRKPTRAELRMWSCLRGERLGAKFRRQHVIGSTYIVDFFCLEKSLIIEIDGGIHDEQIDKDSVRDKCLSELGCRTVRFSNAQVMSDIRAVKNRIKAELNSI